MDFIRVSWALKSLPHHQFCWHGWVVIKVGQFHETWEKFHPMKLLCHSYLVFNLDNCVHETWKLFWLPVLLSRALPRLPVHQPVVDAASLPISASFLVVCCGFCSVEGKRSVRLTLPSHSPLLYRPIELSCFSILLVCALVLSVQFMSCNFFVSWLTFVRLLLISLLMVPIIWKGLSVLKLFWGIKVFIPI